MQEYLSKMNIKTIILEEISNIFEVRENFKTVYHGTSNSGARNIEANGIDINKSEGGYFGKGFYCAINFDLARSNYAEFADENDIDERGAVMEFQILPEANILDLRDADDWDTYLPFSRTIFNPSHPQQMINAGIDGLYDNSFEGVVIYNPEVLKYIKTINL